MTDEDHAQEIRSLREQADELNKLISENLVEFSEASPETRQELVDLLKQIKQAGITL
jgi:hypothetical protein